MFLPWCPSVEGGENKPHSRVHLALLPGVTRHLTHLLPCFLCCEGLCYQTVSQSTLVLPAAAFVANLVTAVGKVANMRRRHLRSEV